MNQGKIWLVVKPTVGLPLFLGGVAVIALAVHTAILTNTTWYPAYYSGKAKVAAAVAPAKTSMATPSVDGKVAAADAPVLLATAPPGKQ